MRKLVFVFLILILLYASSSLFKNIVGDLRPALLPPPSTSSETPAIAGEKPSIPLSLPAGFQIGVFAKGLGSPRDIVFSEKGTLLASIPGGSKVVALPDRNNDGATDEVKNILTNLDNPHGVAFHKEKLYVVEETKVVRYQWNEDTLSATKEKDLFTLPGGGRHSTRTIAFNNKGQMFISLGSTCDTCFEKHEWLAAVVVASENGDSPKLFAKGLRNSVFITINPKTDALWGTEMGRDFLGDNLPPDEVNIITEGDYGWPVCYGQKIYDAKFGQKDASYCNNTIAPIFEIPAHSAPLGLTFIEGDQFPKEWQGDLLVAYHGSWNSSTPVGYKVVHLTVAENTITKSEDFLTGFLSQTQALGRPADLAFDKEGSLYISDDKAGTLYKVTYSN